jgi:cellulose synthase/poly-beta-1,6-N-acetylglucosamine synthase-like glycosyltransferase
MEKTMITFWTSVSVIIYIFALYPLILKWLNALFKRQNKISGVRERHNDSVPRVSILIPAFNEEKRIKKRIENLLASDYPGDKMEIIIASDGSSDRTVEFAEAYADDGVIVLEFKSNRGRASVQNDGVREAGGEIVIFTDAETVFEKDFIKCIKRRFEDPAVGCAVGNLVYDTRNSAISSSEGIYFRYEKMIRQLESDLGILATATGACMAVRRELWRDLTPIDDSDFTTPLDVILQGRRVVYAPDAVAYDVPASTVRGELRSRIRQTSKNLIGTLKRWGVKGWFRHFIVSWGLFSHKILRWLTPFFMLTAFISNLFLLDEGSLYRAAFTVQAAFYALALAGLLGELVKKRVPIGSPVFSFCVANIGMGLGVIKGLAGRAPAAYETTE